jgi:glycosyltransferase involved in cell wall biosynthesis
MFKKLKTSLIVTVLNEGQTILPLLKSIAEQTYLPTETIIVDGGSSDDTFQKLEKFAATVQGKLIGLKVYQQAGNRSRGRNFAITKAKHEWIAITDAGCTLDKKWLGELQAAVGQGDEISVVAGYYQGLPTTPFEEAVIPYVLVMPDQVDPENFLPATRSMMIKKEVWQQLGGFDESLSHNEDYAFAKKIESSLPKSTLTFTEQAVVLWNPPRTLPEFATMIFRFACGDVEARIFRPKVGLLFLRYLVAAAFLITAFSYQNAWLWGLVGIEFSGYLLWSIRKNSKYITRGWNWLPILQLCSDVMIMLGSLRGLIGSRANRSNR